MCLIVLLNDPSRGEHLTVDYEMHALSVSTLKISIQWTFCSSANETNLIDKKIKIEINSLKNLVWKKHMTKIEKKSNTISFSIESFDSIHSLEAQSGA